MDSEWQWLEDSLCGCMLSEGYCSRVIHYCNIGNDITHVAYATPEIFFFNVSCGCCHLVSVYFREFPSKAADIPRNSLLSVKGGIVFGNPTSLFLVEIYGLYFYRLSGGPLVSETLAGHGCNLLATHTFSPFWHLTFLCSTGLPRSPLGS